MGKTGRGKVSIVMPAYNRGYIIQNAVRSVLAQTYTDWELLIIDDGSTDDTASRVAQMKDSRIVLIRYDTNRGANHARNVGMEKSSGEYIAFLDSDNEWVPEYLEKQLDYLHHFHDKVDVVFARTLIINGKNRMIFPSQKPEELADRIDMIKCAMFNNICDTNVVLMRRSVWEGFGGFDEGLRRLQDWDYFLDLLIKGEHRFKFNDEILCTNNLQKDSITNTGSLFWDAWLHIFEKNIGTCRSLNLVADVLCFVLQQETVEHILHQQAEKIFLLLNPEEKEKFCKNSHKIAQELMQQKNGHRNTAKKNERILTVQKNWIMALNRGKRLDEFLYKNHLKCICIYGFGVLGKVLWDTLKNSMVQVKYIIDNNAASDAVKIYKLEDMPQFDADAVIVTAIADFEEISASLPQRTGAPVLSLEKVIGEFSIGNEKDEKG